MSHCEALRVGKFVRKQSQQICLKLFILILSCTTLCLVCFCVESYRQRPIIEHSSEKLIQYAQIFGHESGEDSRKPRSKELLFHDGSGAEPTSAEIEAGWSKKEDNLENLYTTVVDENFNVWKDNSNAKVEDVFVAKETVGLEEYIAHHKSQTIDTSAEQTTTIKTTSELCQQDHSEETTTAGSIEKQFIEFNAPIPADIASVTTEQPSPMFDSNQMSAESADYHSNSQSERFAEMLKTEKPYIEHHIVATPPRPIKSVENYNQPQVWFTDDYDDFEQLIARSEKEDRKQLEKLYKPEEIISAEVYISPAEEENPYEAVNYRQQTSDYEDYAADYDGQSVLLPDIQTPRFIEQLLGNLNKMSHLFAPIPPPNYNPYSSSNNHLSNFHETYEPDQQYFASNHQKKFKHKNTKPKMHRKYYEDDMDVGSSNWYRKQPSKDIMEAIKLLKVLFQKQILE